MGGYNRETHLTCLTFTTCTMFYTRRVRKWGRFLNVFRVFGPLHVKLDTWLFWTIHLRHFRLYSHRTQIAKNSSCNECTQWESNVHTTWIFQMWQWQTTKYVKCGMVIITCNDTILITLFISYIGVWVYFHPTC